MCRFGEHKQLHAHLGAYGNKVLYGCFVYYICTEFIFTTAAY